MVVDFSIAKCLCCVVSAVQFVGCLELVTEVQLAMHLFQIAIVGLAFEHICFSLSTLSPSMEARLSCSVGRLWWGHFSLVWIPRHVS